MPSAKLLFALIHPPPRFRRLARTPLPQSSSSYYNALHARSRYRIGETEYPYFLTCTVVGWLPVFTRPEAVQIVFDCWDFLRQNREFALYGYVVLENHLHLIASAPDLTNAMKSFKMFTAKALIEVLERHSAEMLLRQLRR